MSKSKYVTEVVDHWDAPDENDARLLGMPVIPPQMFFMAPRNFMGPAAWNKMRKACYEKAEYKCEICGYQCEPGKMHAHEVYSINYKTGESKFIRPVGLCIWCHLYNIHVSRALTEYKHGNPIYSSERLLEAIEHGFKVIEEWNKSHSEEEKIRKHAALLEYLRQDELKEPLKALIEKYHIEFYAQPLGKECAPWSDWKLLYNGKEYKTPYKDQADLDKHLKKADKKTKRFDMTDRMKGGVFDEIDNIIKKGEGK